MRSGLLGFCLLGVSLLIVSRPAQADSIWIYTFSDQFNLYLNNPQQIGFSFSLPSPLQIGPTDTLVLTPGKLDTCVVPTGGSCIYAQMWWQAPEDFRVHFVYSYPWLSDDADFHIDSLSDQQTYVYSVTDQATFTIHDPVITPEPAGWTLFLLAGGIFAIWMQRQKCRRML